ncbi:hypothetical protein [Ralstonia sp. ASV6]|uniref:hypothetical protein n=1 Tax=Ralstonia sp. ASV6 TaxID=2795124 RepID=UPI0018EA7C26|nr:hypothetical protein [Ralstonia sp. ASV6]
MGDALELKGVSGRSASFVVPDPATRVPESLYREVRHWLLENDPDAAAMVDWSANRIGPPADSGAMAGEIIWIILCAGRKAQAARTIERKVWRAINAGEPVVNAFGYRAKAEAIEKIYRERDEYFTSLLDVLAMQDDVALVEWCGSLPYVGQVTKYQLAKNFGADVAKPDIWLCRLAGFPDQPRKALRFRFPACMALCEPLAKATGDSIATVDTLLWLACNKGTLCVDDQGGPVSFHPLPSRHRPVL